MKTSSRVGRATLTERIEWVSSANSRGTNCSPDATLNVTRPSWTAASRSNRSLSSWMVAWSSVVEICTRSLPTLAFSASGVSIATILPWSMMAMRSQFSASSM